MSQVKNRQTTTNIFMVRPANFGFNHETAENNSFQINDQSLTKEEIRTKAKAEFDQFVEKLRKNGINVIVGEEPDIPVKTDSVFPNNWVTFHKNGAVITYPMFSPNRRLERSEDFLDQIAKDFEVKNRYKLESYEEKNIFLEGTGSMIFDRENQIVYACRSPRTHELLLNEFSKFTDSEIILFDSVDSNGQDIYHTNVMMAMGESFVVICLESIPEGLEKAKLKEKFAETNKEIIEISFKQVEAFAGNMLQVRNRDGETFLVMSEQAFKALNESQIAQIEKHTHILYSPIPIIETYGGGSVRCMMAEVFLKEKEN